VKKSEKQRKSLTRAGKTPGGKFRVIIELVSLPKDKYPQTPNTIIKM